MPDQEWGNGDNVKHEVDMVSPVGYKLEVTKNAASTTLKTSNSNGNGFALEAVGKSKLNGDVEVSDNKALTIVDGDRDGPALSVKNSNGGEDAYALEVDGRSILDGDVIHSGMLYGYRAQFGYIDENIPAIGLSIGTMDCTHCIILGHSGIGTRVQGNLSVYDETLIAVSGEENQDTALTVTNNSEHENARALKVNGKTELDGSVVGDIDVSDKGCVKINDVNDGNDGKIALHTIINGITL